MLTNVREYVIQQSYFETRISSPIIRLFDLCVMLLVCSSTYFPNILQHILFGRVSKSRSETKYGEANITLANVKYGDQRQRTCLVVIVLRYAKDCPNTSHVRRYPSAPPVTIRLPSRVNRTTFWKPPSGVVSVLTLSPLSMSNVGTWFSALWSAAFVRLLFRLRMPSVATSSNKIYLMDALITHSSTIAS